MTWARSSICSRGPAPAYWPYLPETSITTPDSLSRANLHRVQIADPVIAGKQNRVLEELQTLRDS